MYKSVMELTSFENITVFASAEKIRLSSSSREHNWEHYLKVLTFCLAVHEVPIKKCAYFFLIVFFYLLS